MSPHNRHAVRLHHYGIRDKNYRVSKILWQIEISKLSLMGSCYHIRSSTGYISWTSPVPGIQQWPPSRVSSSVPPFAEDCLLYRVIRDQQDKSLQTDLNHIQEWEREWPMYLIRTSANIWITNKRKVIQTPCNVHGQTFNETSKAKYLGVTIYNTLSYNISIKWRKRPVRLQPSWAEIFRAAQRMSWPNATSS